jgi:hypothetical protein
MAPLLASRYCDLCAGMPWWGGPILVGGGFLIAMAILTGFVRLDALFSARRAARRGDDPPDDGVR